MKWFFILLTTFLLSLFITEYSYADKTYIIKKGDNPTRIAKKFNVKTEDILRINNINPRKLKPGVKIIIPTNSIKTAEKTSKHKEEDSQNKTQVTNYNEDALFHIVIKGDTLTSISKRYGVSVNELKKLNHLSSTRLKIGKKLVVKETKTKVYTVRKGDTIYEIAKRFKVNIDELKDINNFETDLLKPGQKILLERQKEATDSPKKYDTIISQAHTDDEIQLSEISEDIGIKERLMLFAKKMLDIPYRFGGNSILGIDCSAYVKKVYSLIGIDLPRSAREQFTQGEPVDKEDLSVGDLVFFRTYASFPSHVGIYLGNNLFIHASSKKKKVTIDSIDAPYYLKRFIGAKRVIDKVDDEKPDNDG